MRTIAFLLGVIVMTSCQQPAPQETENPKWTAYESKLAQEKETEQTIRGYIEAANSKNWREQMSAYLGDTKDFYAEHSVFRKSFPDYKMTVQRAMVDGDKGIIWLACSGTFTEPYILDKESSYGDDILKKATAKGQRVAWEEVWSFSIVDGKLGDDFKMVKDQYAVLQALDVE